MRLDSQINRKPDLKQNECILDLTENSRKDKAFFLFLIAIKINKTKKMKQFSQGRTQLSGTFNFRQQAGNETVANV